MLVSFSVSNFRSFGDEGTLNMVASNRLVDHKSHLVHLDEYGIDILRAAVIYGANAAGKSNLIKAMKFAQDAIRGVDQLPTQPFRFDEKFWKQPSSFEFRFVAEGKVFAYGFDINHDIIDDEWLALLAGGEEHVIFRRDSTGHAIVDNTAAAKLYREDPRMLSILDLLQKIPLKSRQLFLNRASSIPEESQGKFLSGIIRWLTKDLVILNADSRRLDIMDRLDSDEMFRRFAGTFLQSVGTGVAGLHVMQSKRAVSEFERAYYSEMQRLGAASPFPLSATDHAESIIDPSDPNSVITRMLWSSHGANSPLIPFGEESDGTKQLLHLLPMLAATSGSESKVVIIDELDRSLHPILCWQFIRFFSEYAPGARRQLLVTTHEAHLLDQELLRRDEYWFVEKDSSQQTRMVSLVEFNIRKDLQVEKGYLQGRFGAIPVIGGMDTLERLLTCGNEQEPVNAPEAKAP